MSRCVLGALLFLLCAGCKPEARSWPESRPWLAYWAGVAHDDAELDHLAQTYRVIVMNPDPDNASWTVEQVQRLKANGKNRVLSYLNIGSCERVTSYWSAAPEGLVSCGANTAAHRGQYAGYPDEEWMDPSNEDFQRLILEHVSARLAAFPVDGFLLDNLEMVEHGTDTTNGPCDAACAQGGLDLVRKLRERYPDFLLVINHATGDFARKGSTGGISFPSLIDGVHQEGTYLPIFQTDIEAQLSAWRAMNLTRGGTPFWIATTEYATSCDDVEAARSVFERSKAKGISASVTPGVDVFCDWPSF